MGVIIINLDYGEKIARVRGELACLQSAGDQRKAQLGRDQAARVELELIQKLFGVQLETLTEAFTPNGL